MEYPDDPKDPDYLGREVGAYGRLLAGLDKLVIVPDRDVERRAMMVREGKGPHDLDRRARRRLVRALPR